jgi:outer membrane protein TolC
MRITYLLALLAGSAMLVGGCVMEPAGAKAERDRLARAGLPYAAPWETRQLPELPAQVDWPDVLRRALLANGELEVAYLDWKSAMAGIQISGQWPNAGVALGYEYMFTKEKVKGWNRSTLLAGLDPSMNVQLPAKAAQAAKVAYQEVRAKAERFRAAKVDLQRKVLLAYHDWALLAEKDPFLANIRGEERFKQLMERVKYEWEHFEV